MTEAQSRYEFSKAIGKPKVIPINCFYVYIITEGEIVCYIGKGTGKRVLSHFNGRGNVLLGTKIKSDPHLYSWAILEEYDNEYDCLDYEEQLILECKKAKHKLYNKVHYDSSSTYNKEFRGIFGLFKQYEERIFPSQMSTSMSLIELLDILFKMVKEVCQKVSLENIPLYRGRRLDQLNYFITPYRDKNRVNIY